MNGHRRKQFKKSRIMELLDEIECNVGGREQKVLLGLAELGAKYLLWREKHIHWAHYVGGGLRRALVIRIWFFTFHWWLPN